MNFSRGMQYVLIMGNYIENFLFIPFLFDSEVILDDFMGDASNVAF